MSFQTFSHMGKKLTKNINNKISFIRTFKYAVLSVTHFYHDLNDSYNFNIT